MSKRYVTIVGLSHYFGIAPFSIEKKVKCVKEPGNPFDSEAIRVKMKGIGTVGYIGNSTHSVVTGTMSAGRLYDKIGNKFKVRVLFICSNFVIGEIVENEPVPPEKEEMNDEKETDQ
jgi:hypothetical protein